MINSFGIKNFKNLNNLTIKSFSKVNLITGKNNTGKTTLLEAIYLFASKGSLKCVFDILDKRGELYKTEIKEDEFIKIFSSLFTSRIIDYNDSIIISIGELVNTLFEKSTINDNAINIKFIKYYIEDIYQTDNSSGTLLVTGFKKKRVINSENIQKDIKISLNIKYNDNLFSLEFDDFSKKQIRILNKTVDNILFITSNKQDSNSNAKLWDKIALTEKEEIITETLKIIEPDLERIAFVDKNDGYRIPIMKIKGNSNLLPLKSMGDGINRIFDIILAFVNSESNVILIDEIENGLHYSTQEDLWKVIFDLSKKLNIQVFATTHSSDCIKSFEYVMNNFDYKKDGKLIRLDNKKGVIKEVEFDSDELKIANEQDIEIR